MARRGKRIVTVVPSPRTLSAETRPPCSSTNCLTMLRPSPSPRLLNPKSPEEWRLESNWVKNGWKRRFSGPGLEADPLVGDLDLGLVGRGQAGASG